MKGSVPKGTCSSQNASLSPWSSNPQNANPNKPGRAGGRIKSQWDAPLASPRPWPAMHRTHTHLNTHTDSRVGAQGGCELASHPEGWVAVRLPLAA